jgi:hypothetical protein
LEILDLIQETKSGQKSNGVIEEMEHRVKFCQFKKNILHPLSAIFNINYHSNYYKRLWSNQHFDSLLNVKVLFVISHACTLAEESNKPKSSRTVGISFWMENVHLIFSSLYNWVLFRRLQLSSR